MKRVTISTVASAAVLAAVLAGGCSSGTGGQNQAASTPTEPTESTRSGSVSRVKTYETLSELWQDSDVLVTAHVVSIGDEHASVGDGVGPMPYFDVEMSIDRVLASQPGIEVATAQTLMVRQYGASNAEIDSVIPLFEGETDYALFLDQFEFEPGQPTGEWVVSGATGAYEVSSVDGTETVVHLDEENPELPSSLGLQELVAQATDS